MLRFLSDGEVFYLFSWQSKKLTIKASEGRMNRREDWSHQQESDTESDKYYSDHSINLQTIKECR